MNYVTTFTFTDADSGDEVCIIVRCYDEASVAFTVSLKSNGDLAVVMHKQELSKLIDALMDARNRID